MKRFLIGLLLFPLLSFSQNFKIFYSLNFYLGKFQKIGLALNYVYVKDFYQFSGRLDLHFTKRGIALPFSYDEAQINFAFLVGFKDFQNTFSNIKASYFQNFINKKNAFGYSINFYVDDVGTTQKTGTFLLQFNRFQIVTENDIFAQRASDKFRTAAFKFSFIDTFFTYSFSTLMWTPNPKNVRVVFDSLYPAHFGYKDLTKQKFGSFSTGIAFLQVSYSEYSAALGYESEWIRYFFQNKLIHDMYFVPEKINKAKNPHYPMVSDDGSAFLFRKGQKVKKGNWFYFLSKNGSVFY